MPRILFCDDESALRATVRPLLETLGHEVVLACDGVEGTECLQKQEFDVVITDMRMPALDGMAVIKASRQLQPAARIIASGGDGSLPAVDPAAIARQLGVHAVLPKPYGIDELRAAIGKALEGPGDT